MFFSVSHFIANQTCFILHVLFTHKKKHLDPSKIIGRIGSPKPHWYYDMKTPSLEAPCPERGMPAKPQHLNALGSRRVRTYVRTNINLRNTVINRSSFNEFKKVKWSKRSILAVRTIQTQQRTTTNGWHFVRCSSSWTWCSYQAMAMPRRNQTSIRLRLAGFSGVFHWSATWFPGSYRLEAPWLDYSWNSH